MNPLRATRLGVVVTAACVASACWMSAPLRCAAGDLSMVPLLDGERSDSLNLWDGVLLKGNATSFARQTSVKRSGVGSFALNLGALPNGASKFAQTFSSSTASQSYRQDRDLTLYDSLSGYVRNDTGVPLTFSLEIKDYRDSTAHSAVRSFTLPAGAAWTGLDAPLDLGSGWTVTGAPDLKRTYALSFLVNNTSGSAGAGSLYLDDFSLKEKGPSIDVQTAPIGDVVERLAYRTFMGLWQARNKTSALIPNSADNTAIGALNTTTGVVWTLPSAVRHGWVTQADADAYMTQLATTLNTNRNQTRYLPTRFLDLVTGAPVTDHEESSIDAAFIALALHNYKSQATTPPAVAAAIDAVQDRFDFASFMTSGAARQAFFQPTNSFGCCTYSGYTSEHKVIALAAEVSDTFHVPLASQWNKDTGRVLASLVDPNQNHLVYSFGTEYRAPFVQALLNLFVDTSDRGADNYPTRSLARNPWTNFVRYEAEVAAKLEQLGRDNLAQPDAGAAVGTYQPWNLYNNFGQPNVFQPWSVAFMLQAGAPGAEEALRFLLDTGLTGGLTSGLDGPLGLADSAVWATGAAGPSSVPSYVDNWNMALALMALMEVLDGDQSASRLFADLPGVDAALNTVFVAGDYDGNGLVQANDYTTWRNAFGSRTLLASDGNNDGVINAADYVLWRDSLAAGPGASITAPEPSAVALVALCLGSLLRRRPRAV